MAFMEVASMGLGLVSSLMGGRAQKRAARKAAEEARKQRDWFEAQARETQGRLGREIESMRTLRDLDLPAFQQAAETAMVQRGKASERIARNRALGRTTSEVRDAVFGGQLTQYLGREQQKMQHHTQLTQQIFEASNQAQAQVNQLMQAGGQAYASGMQTATQMEAQAGDPLGQALGAVSQGLSLAASASSKKEAMQSMMEQQSKSNFMQQALLGDMDVSKLGSRATSIMDLMNPKKWGDFNKFMFPGAN